MYENRRSGSVNRRDSYGGLYFLCGTPRSGKSTFANNWVNEPVGAPRVIVSGDDIRQALTGREYAKNAEAAVFSLMDTITLALLIRGFDVLVDETSTSPDTLKRYLRLHPDPVMIMMDTPIDICIERARQHNQEYLVPVIERCGARLTELFRDWPSIKIELASQVQPLYQDYL